AAACLQAGEQAIALYLPGTIYEEPQGTLLQEIQATTHGPLPYFSFAQSQEPKERVVENDTTIQATSQENERRIVERKREENSREADEEENQRQQGEQAAAEGPAEEAAPSPEPELQPVAQIPMENLQDYQYLLNEFFVVDPNTVTSAAELNAGT